MFDLTIGDESYKRDWCDTVLALFDHITAATLRGALDVLRLKVTLDQQTPLLRRLASRARTLVGALRR